MVRLEILEKEAKISRIIETELQRYVDFFTESYQDNLKHSEDNIERYPKYYLWLLCNA